MLISKIVDFLYFVESFNTCVYVPDVGPFVETVLIVFKLSYCPIKSVIIDFKKIVLLCTNEHFKKMVF